MSGAIAPRDGTEEEEEQRVAAMAVALRKALGATAERQPDIFMRAVEMYRERLARAIEEQCVGAFKESRGLPYE
jgi:hypothetical protein